MIESGYLPPGAEYDKAAPWMDKEIPERKFDVTCCQALSKTSSVSTDNYCCTTEKEWDGEGWVGITEYDTSCTNWAEEYHSNDHYTPIQLIELFQKYLLDEVNGSCTVSRNPQHLHHLITECNNWMEDETEYFRE